MKKLVLNVLEIVSGAAGLLFGALACMVRDGVENEFEIMRCLGLVSIVSFFIFISIVHKNELEDRIFAISVVSSAWLQNAFRINTRYARKCYKFYKKCGSFKRTYRTVVSRCNSVRMKENEIHVMIED